MPMLNPTTELEAVNEMLMSIGQAPVSTLNVTGIKDVNTAKTLLTAQTRRVAIKKYNWNTDENYDLQPDVDGVVLIPQGALDVDPMSPSDNYVIRRHPARNALALWNKDLKTWTFPSAVSVKVTWGFVFEDMPELARSYIHISAGRIFQKRIIGSDLLDSFEAEDEMKAWVELQRTELSSRDNNLFRKNAAIGNINNRRY